MEIWDVYDKDRKLTGKTAVRGQGLDRGDYHLVVHVWIVNSEKELLISQRTPNKTFPRMWECTGGSALKGDDSLMAALREVEEEIGIQLKSSHGQMLYSNRFDNDVSSYFRDVWLFKEEVDIKDVVYQAEEVMDAKWANQQEIETMIGSGTFIDHFSYIEDLFQHIENL